MAVCAKAEILPRSGFQHCSMVCGRSGPCTIPDVQRLPSDCWCNASRCLDSLKRGWPLSINVKYPLTLRAIQGFRVCVPRLLSISWPCTTTQLPRTGPDISSLKSNQIVHQDLAACPSLDHRRSPKPLLSDCVLISCTRSMLVHAQRTNHPAEPGPSRHAQYSGAVLARAIRLCPGCFRAAVPTTALKLVIRPTGSTVMKRSTCVVLCQLVSAS